MSVYVVSTLKPVKKYSKVLRFSKGSLFLTSLRYFLQISWMFMVHWSFNYSDTRRKQELLLQWMRLSGEMPSRRVVGLSRKENARFWLAEKRLNSLWYRVSNIALLISCCILSTQLFFVSFNVDIVTYAFLQTLHIVHFFWHLFPFLHVSYSPNLFLLTLIRFFRLKFHSIAGRIKHLDLSNRKAVNNRKLARLLYELNVVHLELFAMRDLFKDYIGYSLCHCFLISLLATFACLFADVRMAVTALLIVFIMGLAVIFPFYFATSVVIEVILDSRISNSKVLSQNLPL